MNIKGKLVSGLCGALRGFKAAARSLKENVVTAVKVAVGVLGFGAATGVGRAADFVAYDSTAGTVSFDPSALVSPIMGAIVAGILAGIAIPIAWRGVKWIFRVVFGSR